MGKRGIVIWFILASFIILTSTYCELVNDITGTEPIDQDSVNVLITNPRDTKGSNPMISTLTFSGDLTFDQNINTVKSRSVGVSWVTTGDGIVDDLSFQYKYTTPGVDTTSVPFIDINDQSFSVTGLEESFADDSLYNFILKVSLPSNNNVPERRFSTQFIVDVVEDKGFVFSPNQITINGNGQYEVEIYVDEIEENDDIVAYKLDVLFNTEELTLINADIYNEISFFRPGNAGVFGFSSIKESNSDIDTLRIESGIFGSSLSGKSGAGKVAKLTFELNNATNNPSISISPESFFRLNDDPIVPTNIVVGAGNTDTADFIINN